MIRASSYITQQDVVDPHSREAGKTEAQDRKAKSRGGVPGEFLSIQGTLFGFYRIQIVFDACSIYPHQAQTNANDKKTVKDYIFLQNSTHTEKYSNINCAEWWIPAKRCRIS